MTPSVEPISSIAVPFGDDVSEETIKLWLGQFRRDEVPIVCRLLAAFSYYNVRRLNSALLTIHDRIINLVHVAPEEILFVQTGYPARSGSLVAYLHRLRNGIPKDRFVTMPDLVKLCLDRETPVVFLDDFIGTGRQATEVWQHAADLDLLCRDRSRMYIFAAAVGTESGITFVQKHTGFHVLVAEVLPRSVSVLSRPCSLFSTEVERVAAVRVLERYGEALYPEHPLGYKGSASLVGFFYSTPNNTLPIFWATTDGWIPLLPHQGPQRQLPPITEIAPVPLLTRGDGAQTTTPAESADPSGPVVAILAKFGSLSNVNAIAPAVWALKMDEQVLRSLLALIDRLASAEHEKAPVVAAVLVAPRGRLRDELLQMTTKADPGLKLDSIEHVLSMALLIDGFSGAVVACGDGGVVGVCQYGEAASASDPSLPPRYWRAAAASRRLSALVFLFAGHGRVSVLYCGRRILVRRGASWNAERRDLSAVLNGLTEAHEVDVRVLENVLRCCYFLSDRGAGALIMVGDHDKVRLFSKALASGRSVWNPTPLGDIPSDSILGLMGRDGATVVSSDGTVLEGMLQLVPPQDGVMEEEIGRGIRHATAARASLATNALGIAVSVDGSITVYSKGRPTLKVVG